MSPPQGDMHCPKRMSRVASQRTVGGLSQKINEAQKGALPFFNGNGMDNYGNLLGDQDNKSKARVSFLKLLSFSTPKERWLMVLGVFCATVSGFGLPVWLILLARALDTFSSLAVLIEEVGGDALYDYLRTELNNLCVAFAILGFVCLVSGTLYVGIWTYTGEKQSLRIRKAFVRGALNQDAGWFDENDRNELPSMMGTSLMHINHAIGRHMVDTYALGISAAGALGVALALNSQLTLIMLCAFPVVIVMMLIFNWFIRKAKKQANKELGLAGSIATECISGIKTVAAFCSQSTFGQQYDEHVNEAQRLSVRGHFLAAFLAGLTGLLFYSVYTVAFYIGTEQVITGAARATIVRCFITDEPDCRVTGASVMCCIYGVILSITFAGLTAPGISAINVGRQAAVDVFDTIFREPVIDPSSSGGRSPDKCNGEIQFKDLYFHYPSDTSKPIFYRFNLNIKAGDSVALVGPSGSGKSTIAKLLLRFYDPNDGAVLIDGENLKDVNIAWWRNQIGYVEQQPRLFPGTIRENIALGVPAGKVTDDQVVESAKMACAHEFIMDLPEGYDTFYSGTSLQLSGGQMQRIAIARAIIRNPAILILDEATSALDSQSESLVQKALGNIRRMRKMTTVTIAHRLTTIVDSDQIAVISNGQLAELGHHKSLIDNGGIYALLCESQGITKDFSTNQVSVDAGEDAKMEPNTTLKSAIEQPLAETEGVLSLSEEEKALVEVELAPMSKIMAYVGTDAGYMALGVLGSMITGALSPAESILTANIVTNFYTVPPDEMLEANRKYILSFFIFALAVLIGNLMVGIGLSRTGPRLGSKMRRTAFSAILNRSMGWFDDPDNTVGELTTLLAVDSEAVSALVGVELGNRIKLMSSLLTGVIIAFYFSSKIGIVAILCVPLIMLPGFVQACCNRKKFESESTGLSAPAILEQGLRGISSVQAYGLEKKVGRDYASALDPESASKVKQGTIAGFVFGFSQCMIFVSFAIVFYVGSDLLVEVEIGFIEFFTAVLAVMFGAIGASQVSADFSGRQNAQAAAARIFSVFDGPEDGGSVDATSSDKSSLSHPLKGEIEFEDVKFAYPTRPGHPIFYLNSEGRKGLNLKIPAKKSLGFVGKSGSGKSTVLQLLLRFYDRSDGMIRVDQEQDLNNVNVAWLRGQIGYVGQQPTLFRGTVRENITLGMTPPPSEEEIYLAAKSAHADEFITRLSNGYDTNIGPGGDMLSGGQKQRIAIARAILRRPAMLVLDEATAALDNESEKIVQAALDEIQEREPRTTLVVAHRLQTVKNCDEIVFLGDGGVEESGTHSELLEKDGQYAKLWKMQSAEEALTKKNEY